MIKFGDLTRNENKPTLPWNETTEETAKILRNMLKKLYKEEPSKDSYRTPIYKNDELDNIVKGFDKESNPKRRTVLYRDYFEICPETDLSIGYHIQEVEDVNEPELKLEDLTNDRPLFISSNFSDWYPSHLAKGKEEGRFRTYKILFSVENMLVFRVKGEATHFKSPYFNFFNVKKGKFYLNDEAKAICDKAKVTMFVLNSDKDIFEAFLTNPKDSVKTVRLIATDEVPF